MGYYDDEDGFDNEFDASNPSELRKAQKAAAKRARDLEAENAKLRGQLAERNLTDVLKAKSLRPGLARVITKEDVDLTDPKAIDAWLEDPTNQEDFQFSLEDKGGSSQSQSNGNTGGEEDGSEEETEGSEYAKQYARMRDASQGALPDDKYAQARQQIKGSKSTAETQAALNRAIRNQS